MKMLLPVIIALLLYGGLFWIRRNSTNGGTFGEMIRQSDHHAWQMAVEDKKRELEGLMESEPKI